MPYCTVSYHAVLQIIPPLPTPNPSLRNLVRYGASPVNAGFMALVCKAHPSVAWMLLLLIKYLSINSLSPTFNA
ncbi:hypothetical protein Mettu_2321 [Methylobacter tundripaludum SV96]|uniref:Uncharacterized protein n=1 Tax=Methylobacter tundripaludum (strain ATCC BAA-1195 / DSM 17260 / SV96) TaxID=697282 RepID=G3IXQ9_METTV|nr:hypothetical protein Mettu_2321 [Methylobacter tundripaludum SV96]